MTAALPLPKLDRILEIGFGGGTTAWYLHRYLPNTKITSVELDDKVFELSEKYFGIERDRTDVHTGWASAYAGRKVRCLDDRCLSWPFVPFT